jgi:hypothetical protein
MANDPEISLADFIAILTHALKENGNAALRFYDHDTYWEMPVRKDCVTFMADHDPPYFLVESDGYGSQDEPLCPPEAPSPNPPRGED